MVLDFSNLSKKKMVLDFSQISHYFLFFSSVTFLFQVALTHGPENVKPQVKQTDETGNFCFEVCQPNAIVFVVPSPSFSMSNVLLNAIHHIWKLGRCLTCCFFYLAISIHGIGVLTHETITSFICFQTLFSSKYHNFFHLISNSVFFQIP